MPGEAENSLFRAALFMATAVYPSMVPDTRDGMQPLLVKVAYYLQLAAEALGAVDSSAMFTTMAPQAFDGIQPLLVKIAYWAEQISAGGGGGGNAGVTSGSGDPPTDGSITTLFYRDTTGPFLYINSGTVAAPQWDSI